MEGETRHWIRPTTPTEGKTRPKPRTMVTSSSQTRKIPRGVEDPTAFIEHGQEKPRQQKRMNSRPWRPKTRARTRKIPRGLTWNTRAWYKAWHMKRKPTGHPTAPYHGAQAPWLWPWLFLALVPGCNTFSSFAKSKLYLAINPLLYSLRKEFYLRTQKKQLSTKNLSHSGKITRKQS